MTEASHHLSGVDAVIGPRAVIVEVQQTQETMFVTVFKEGQALLHDCVIGIQEVHPVAAVVQVLLGQRGHAEHIFVTEGDSREGHVVSPHHVDLCDGWVGHQVLDSVPGPDAKKTNAHEEGHDPDDPLRSGLVWAEDKLQPVDLGPPNELHADLFPRRFHRARFF